VKRQIRELLAIGLLVSVAWPVFGSSSQDGLGPIYPIIEPDWLDWLPKQAEKRLREKPPSFTKEQLQQNIRRRMPDIDLPEVKTPRIYHMDPAVTTNQPLTDQQGKILVPSGGKINPLDHLPEFQPVVIIDGRKKKQVDWAKGIIGSLRPLFLITGGDMLKLNEQFGVTVYPAPKSVIDRFFIERVPVILSRDGEQIRVEEVVP